MAALDAEWNKSMEVFEVETRLSPMNSWKPAKDHYVHKDGEPIGFPSLEAFPVPPGYTWGDEPWSVSYYCNEGTTDADGWDYATRMGRFAGEFGRARVPRVRGVKDLARRRRWTRPMHPEQPAATPESTLASSSSFSSSSSSSSSPVSARPRGEGAVTPTTPDAQQAQQALVRTLLDGLGRAQREVAKMAARLGVPGQDSRAVRQAVGDYLGRVRAAQGEVAQRVEALEDPRARAQGKRALADVTSPFMRVEADIARKLAVPPPAAAAAAAAATAAGGPGGPAASGLGFGPQPVEPTGWGGAGSQSVKGGGPGVASSGNGRFSPGVGGLGFGGGGVGGGGGGSGGEDGEYVSRQQQEQVLASRLRAVGEAEVDLQLMNERNVQINQVAENVSTLNELFKDMAQLVSAQQETIDTVESHVESASQRTQEGVAHLERAVQHQKACALM